MGVATGVGAAAFQAVLLAHSCAPVGSTTTRFPSSRKMSFAVDADEVPSVAADHREAWLVRPLIQDFLADLA